MRMCVYFQKLKEKFDVANKLIELNKNLFDGHRGYA